MAKKNFEIEDEYGNALDLYRPAKKGADETLHLEVTNKDVYGDEHVTCINLDFIDASELAETLITYARKLKVSYPGVDDEDCCPEGCPCKADKVEPANDGWPWGADWYKAQLPQTISTSDMSESLSGIRLRANIDAVKG
jgi:hypothetical protein